MQVNEIKNGVIARQGGSAVVANATAQIVLTDSETPHRVIEVKLSEDVSRELLSLLDTSSIGSCRGSSEVVSPATCVAHWESVLNTCCALDDFRLPTGDKSYRWRVLVTVSSWDQESDRIVELGLAACVAALERLVIPTLVWDAEERWWRELGAESMADDQTQTVWTQDSNNGILHSLPHAISLFESAEGNWSTDNAAKTAGGALLVTAVYSKRQKEEPRYIVNLTGGRVKPAELGVLVEHARTALASAQTVFHQIKT